MDRQEVERLLQAEAELDAFEKAVTSQSGSGGGASGGRSRRWIVVAALAAAAAGLLVWFQLTRLDRAPLVIDGVQLGSAWRAIERGPSSAEGLDLTVRVSKPAQISLIAIDARNGRWILPLDGGAISARIEREWFGTIPRHPDAQGKEETVAVVVFASEAPLAYERLAAAIPDPVAPIGTPTAGLQAALAATLLAARQQFECTTAFRLLH